MLEEFLQNYRQRRAIKSWRKSILGQTLARHSREYFYEGETRLSGFSEKSKQKLISDFYADSPYISGELHAHIQKLSEYNEELKELKWTHGDLSDDDLISFCNGRSAVFLYYVNGWNIVRAECNDVGETKDWLRPFIKSSLIWEEGLCRGNIGLPSLLSDSLDSLRHIAFTNMVVNGHANPFYEWEKANPKLAEQNRS